MIAQSKSAYHPYFEQHSPFLHPALCPRPGPQRPSSRGSLLHVGFATDGQIDLELQ
jgi:hypothetical protein